MIDLLWAGSDGRPLMREDVVIGPSLRGPHRISSISPEGWATLFMWMDSQEVMCPSVRASELTRIPKSGAENLCESRGCAWPASSAIVFRSLTDLVVRKFQCCFHHERVTVQEGVVVDLSEVQDGTNLEHLLAIRLVMTR